MLKKLHILKISGFIYIYFFVLLSVLLIFLNWNDISTSTNEVGDFAANSILIQKAKHLRLLAGNYSRVGFNHPGPAILYVLAFGELVFHDWLHWVSPVGGQMITAAFYAALWILLCAAMFMRLSHSRWETLAFSVVVCMTLAHGSPYSFGGLWFPTLYVLPFTAFVIALALFVLGDAWSLIPLALACGFLINGHASFVAITAIMLLGGLCINLFLARRHISAARSWAMLAKGEAPSYVRRRAIVALLVLAGFFVPLIILTVTRFPGPVGDYVHYGKTHIRNSWPDSLYSLAWYWSPSIFVSVSLIVGSIAAILFLPFRYKAPFLASLGLAWVASLLYTRYGIDNLVAPEMRYIGLFTIACPAVAGGLVSVVFIRLLAGRWRPLAVLVIAVAGVAYCGLQIARAPSLLARYDDPEIPVLFAQLQGLGTQKLAFSLDTGGNWEQVWSTVAGLQLYGARQHVPPFVCIARNWHILFTPAARCAPDDLERRRRLVVSSVDNPGTIGRPLVSLDGLNISDLPMKTCLAPGEALTVTKNADEFQNRILDSGWTDTEGTFAWSYGTLSKLRICVRSGAKAVNIDLGAFLPKPDSIQTIDVALGGKAVTTASFSRALPRTKIRLALPATDADQDIEVTLHIDHPISPKEALGTQDTRQLAVSVYGIDAE